MSINRPGQVNVLTFVTTVGVKFPPTSPPSSNTLQHSYTMLSCYTRHSKCSGGQN